MGKAAFMGKLRTKKEEVRGRSAWVGTEQNKMSPNNMARSDYVMILGADLAWIFCNFASLQCGLVGCGEGVSSLV